MESFKASSSCREPLACSLLTTEHFETLRSLATDITTRYSNQPKDIKPLKTDSKPITKKEQRKLHE